MSSLLQIYKDNKHDIFYVQIMSKEGLDYRRKNGLDSILEGTEQLYRSNIPFVELRDKFFKNIAVPHEDDRTDIAQNLLKEGIPYGASFSFHNKVYEDINKEIKEKLGLEELI